MNARLLGIIATALIATASQAQTYTVQEVSSGGYANTISNGVVGGTMGNHAALWTAAGMLDMNPAGATFSGVNGRSGQISVGFAGTASLNQWPVIWDGSVASILETPFDSIVGRVNNTDGIQAVGYGTEGDPERGLGAQHALVWDLQTGDVEDLGKKALVYGVGGGLQTGVELGGKGSTACFWSGTRNSATSLHARFMDDSVATDTDGEIQIGYYGSNVRVRREARPREIRFYSAGYWTGSADSFTNLPNPYRHSFALAIQGDTIVGYGNTTNAIGNPIHSHAVAWIGPNRDYIDLHGLLPFDMLTSRATDVDEDGNIIGYGVTTTGTLKSFIWLRQ